MVISRLANQLNVAIHQLRRKGAYNNNIGLRLNSGAYFRSGALKPKPLEMPFGWFAIICAVIPGLFVGATISKNVANFLEENDLFVPSDDDDDED
ncbi:hypothetical protein KR044_004287 [Drosophila immigrans]|nr:hypothetical protein KR044_004287 [Drosophila immigrans]